MRFVLFFLRHLLHCGLFAVGILSIPGIAIAQTNDGYPSQPIKLIVPFAPGGLNDILARIVANGVSKHLGAVVVTENRAGASGKIGLAAASTAKPDGYTMLLSGTSSHILSTATPPPLAFDPSSAFTAVSLAAKTPVILVVPTSLGVTDLKAAIDLFKSQPGKHAYGSAGIGTLNHFGPAMLFQQVGADVIHAPFQGNAPIVTSLLSGQLSFALLAPSNTTAHVQAGKLRILAVMEAKRLKELPDVPTIAEAGYPELLKFEWSVWSGVFVPAATPRPIVAALHDAIEKTLHDPESTKAMESAGFLPMELTQAQAQQFVSRQFSAWLPELKKIKLE